MKIVIATPILYDSTSPFNHLFKDIIVGFLEDGNQIVRFVAIDDINDDKFKYGISNKNLSYKLYKRKRSNHNNVICRYIRDNFTDLREAIGILREKNVDVLFEDVCYASIWPVLAAKIKGVKVVAMIQDVWPENAVQCGLISENSFIYKFFENIQRVIYKKADKIICISDDMKNFIKSKKVPESKIDVIYNWGYDDNIINISWKKNEFVKKYQLSSKYFYAIYAGNIGKMQNVEIIVKAAEKLQHDENIKFLIIGEGVKKEEIKKMILEKKLRNIEMLPFQPSNLAIHIYSAAGVNIIPLVKGGTKTALPSKTGVVLSCGKPVITCVDSNSEYARMIREKANGFSVDPDDAEMLAKKIQDLTYNHSGDYSYKCFKELFTREKNIKKYKEGIK